MPQVSLVPRSEGLSAPSRSGLGRSWRIGLLVASALAAVIYVFSLPRMPQPPDYFDFADGRTILGIRNGLNVLSNAAFAVVGLAGLAACGPGRTVFRDERERAAWLVFFSGVTLTCVGSAWFHHSPSVDTLVWDRLPMAIAFMGLLAALVTERIEPRAGRWLLWPLVLFGIASVLYWFLTEQAGVGDLRPYFIVQFYPLVALPLVLVLFPRVYTGSSAYLVALAAYLLAKVAEVEDGRIFALGGLVSGHTLKHLLAAAGIGAIAWMLRQRQLLPGLQVTGSGRHGA